MILVLVAVLALVAVIVISVRSKGGGDPGHEPQVEPLTGLRVRTAPDDWVVVRKGLSSSEANVVRGLLESNGIRASLEASGPHADHVGMSAGRATRYTLSVSPADADVVRELLDG